MAISVLQFDSRLEIKQASVTTFSCAPTGTPPPPVNHAGGILRLCFPWIKESAWACECFHYALYLYLYASEKGKKKAGAVTHDACVLFLKCVIKSMETKQISEHINALYTAPVLQQNSFRSAK